MDAISKLKEPVPLFSHLSPSLLQACYYRSGPLQVYIEPHGISGILFLCKSMFNTVMFREAVPIRRPYSNSIIIIENIAMYQASF